MRPRRGAIALTITTLALSLLFSFRTPIGARDAAAAGSTGVVAVAAAGGGATPLGTASAPASTGAAAATPAASATAAAVAGAAGTDGTYTGDAFSTRWGDVQVQVTISGGVITDIVALSYPDNDNHSAQLNARVVPSLRSAVLAAQAASADTVSGATYTSIAYLASVQSALDAAANA